MIQSGSTVKDWFSNLLSSKQYGEESVGKKYLQNAVTSAESALTKISQENEAQTKIRTELSYASLDAFNQAASFGRVQADNTRLASEQSRKNAVSYSGIVIVALLVIFIGWRSLKKYRIL